MGRTGRRPGTTPNCTFLCTSPAALLQAAAILDLHGRGYVEPVRPAAAAAHIYAHQAMALAVQTGGIPRAELWSWLQGAAPFAGLSPDDREAVIDHMLAETILADHDGRLWLGPAGEKRYGRANFRELYAVFASPRLLTVRADARDIGQLEAQFLMALQGPEGHAEACFTLGGRAWLLQHIDWERGLCLVRPAPTGKAPRWNGGARWLGYDLCQALRRILVSDDMAAAWSERARRELTTQRAEHDFLRSGDSALLETNSEITWWNFAGGAANLLLAKILEHELGEKLIAKNSALTFKGQAGKSSAAIHDALAGLRDRAGPSTDDALRFAEAAKRGRLSKFEPCLPDGLLQRFFADTVIDLDSARRAIAAFR